MFSLVLQELDELLRTVKHEEVTAATHLIEQAKRIFVIGAGRSGLALQMAAMRWMHLGLAVHVVGEVTCPAITKNDLLVAASGSGSTASVVRAAEVAQGVGATILAITAQTQSTLTGRTQHVVILPSSTKHQFAQRSSAQYAGSLFEQAVLLLCDTIFHNLWQAGGATSQVLMQRHANLE